VPRLYSSFGVADGLKQLFAALIFLQRVSVGFIPFRRHFRLETAAPDTSCPRRCAAQFLNCTHLRFSRTCRKYPHTDQADEEYYQAAARPHPQTNFREGRDAQTKNNQDDSKNLSPAVWATINGLESQIVPPFCELFDSTCPVFAPLI
jgi:hypothetical protein